MVVEDDEAIAEALAGILEQEGYRTVTAGHGRAALDWLQAHPSPALILLDLMMPVMDGRQFRARQLADPRLAQIPTVILTASRFDTRLVEMNDLAVVLKPLALDHLLEVVRQRVAIPPRYEHLMFVYDDLATFRSKVAGFLGTGLSRDEIGLVIARPAHGAAILEALAALGFDPAILQRQGRLELLDAGEMLARLGGGSISERQFQELTVAVDPRRRGRPMRVFGEMVDVLCEQGRHSHAFALETLWNRIPFDQRDFKLLCGYRRVSLPAEADVARVCEQHSGLLAA